MEGRTREQTAGRLSETGHNMCTGMKTVVYHKMAVLNAHDALNIT